MNGNRLLSMALLGLLWAVTPTISPAIDMNPPQTNRELGEATEFFTNILNTSKNPIIISMARESLRKLNGESPEAQASGLRDSLKNVTEVALLPQTDNTYVVPALVNRKYMATFLIDTGASYTVITPQMAEALGVKPTAQNPTVPVTTANGILYAPIVKLKHVSLGGMQVDDVDAVVTPLGDTPQISGLLGMSFFHGMELSFKQDKLLISR
jgi:clan AA aspartic protease (TIGR02281 family)